MSKAEETARLRAPLGEELRPVRAVGWPLGRPNNQDRACDGATSGQVVTAVEVA